MPAGPPITIRAIVASGSVVTRASTTASSERQRAAGQHRAEVVVFAVGVGGHQQRGDEAAGVVDREHPADLGGGGAVQVDQDQR